jgi:hypothetical protein
MAGVVYQGHYLPALKSSQLSVRFSGGISVHWVMHSFGSDVQCSRQLWLLGLAQTFLKGFWH